MNNLIKLILISILFANCSSPKETETKQKKEFNQELANELLKLKEIDQLAAKNAIPPEQFNHLSDEEWNSKKDSIYRANKNRVDEIFTQYGYPGYDLVGKNAEQAFWLMVQHSDFDPAFQNKILQALEKEVKRENANSRNFGLLTDRVRLNTGKKQLYGTQVTYIQEQCRAIPKQLKDSAGVNQRRAEVGLGPIEEYLNIMSQMHFEMNKENMLKRGVTEPYQYPVSK